MRLGILRNGSCSHVIKSICETRPSGERGSRSREGGRRKVEKRKGTQEDLKDAGRITWSRLQFDSEKNGNGVAPGLDWDVRELEHLC